MTCDTRGGSGVGPAVIRYCLMKGLGALIEGSPSVAGDRTRLRAPRESVFDARCSQRRGPLAEDVGARDQPFANGQHVRHDVRHLRAARPTADGDLERHDEAVRVALIESANYLLRELPDRRFTGYSIHGI